MSDELETANTHEPRPQYTHPPANRPLNGVRIPMLISGIFHCLTAISWFSTCFLFFMGIPLLVLGVFELITFGKLNTTREQQNALQGKCKTYAILDICSIVLFNLPSMVCGIIALTNQNQFDKD